MTTLLERLGAQVWDVRRGERVKTALMTGNLLSLIAAYTLVEPVADSLFLSQWGAGMLPLFYVVSSLPVAGVAALYGRFARSERIERLVLWTLAILASNLVVFRWALGADLPGTTILLYLWTSVFGILVTSQFWLLANHLFDAREAKRLFALVGMGAIVGGVVGGGLAARLARVTGSEDLLVIALGFLAASAALTVAVGRREPHTLAARHAEVRKEAILAGADEGSAWAAIRRSRHLVLLVAFGGATVFAATLVDYVFKAVATAHFASEDALTSFLGSFQAGLSAVSLLLQLLILLCSPALLRALGVGGVLLILPATLLAGATALLVAPQLATATVVKGADAGLRHSIHRSTFELLFLPIPIAVKRRTKAAVDMFGDRVARAFTGLVLLALLALGWARTDLLALGLAVVATAITVLAGALQREYVASLRASVAGRGLDPEREPGALVDPATLGVLRRALTEESPRQVTYALELLRPAAGPWLRDDLRPLLARPEPEVRQAALEALLPIAGPEDLERVEPLLADPDDRVRSLAVEVLCARAPGARARFLAGGDVRLEAAAVACLAAGGPGEGLERARLERLLAEPGAHRTLVRREVARALARAADPRLSHLLEELIREPDVVTARTAIEAAGRLRDTSLVPFLVSRLGDPALRDAARRALAAFGDPLLPALEHELADPRNPAHVRAALPRVLTYVGTPAAAAVLLRSLHEPEADVRNAVLKALGRLRESHPGLVIDGHLVERELAAEARLHYELLGLLRDAAASRPATAAHLLLQRALREHLDRSLERIFRLLGLRYPPRDIFHIYRKVVNAEAGRRASALELLDNLLQPDLKRFLFPILDPPSLDAALETGRRIFQLSSESVADGLRRLIAGRDSWLRAVALHLVAEERMAALRPDCELAAADPDPVVAAEARRASRLLAEGAAATPPAGREA